MNSNSQRNESLETLSFPPPLFVRSWQRAAFGAFPHAGLAAAGRGRGAGRARPLLQHHPHLLPRAGIAAAATPAPDRRHRPRPPAARPSLTAQPEPSAASPAAPARGLLKQPDPAVRAAKLRLLSGAGNIYVTFSSRAVLKSWLSLH